MIVKRYLSVLISFIVNPNKRKLIGLCLKSRGKVGLEIGGPSNFFKSISSFPVYLFAKKIDGVNYSDETVWEGAIRKGNNYNYYKRKSGYQYIYEATNLSGIKEQTYDFVLSSHSLEHVANPLQALFEWKRVLKPKGFVVIVLPKKESTFDHKRPFTTFEHLLGDYKNNVQEDDSTHFQEIIQLHDRVRDPGLTVELAARTFENYKNRCVHHHVFNLQLVKDLLQYSGFSVLHQQELHNFHLVTIAELI